MAYRRCTWHLRLYGQVQLMEQITQWVEKAYVNNFLLPLADRWSDQVRRLATWECRGSRQHNAVFQPIRPTVPEQRTKRFSSSSRMPCVMRRRQNSPSGCARPTVGPQKWRRFLARYLPIPSSDGFIVARKLGRGPRDSAA